MERFIKYFVTNRNVTIFIIVIILLGGTGIYSIMPRQEFPDSSMPACNILTIYPGASAKDVHELVSTKIEDKLREIDGYSASESVSKDSVSFLFVEYDINVDVNATMQEVRNKIADIKSELPSGTLNSEINTNVTETSTIVLSLSDQNMTNAQLVFYAKDLKDNLLEIDGVKKINFYGEKNKEIKITVDFSKLNKLKLGINDISNVLTSQNITMPQGSVKINGEKIRIQTNGMFEDIEQIKNTVIGVSALTGSTIILKDIAEVSFDYEEDSPNYKSNGTDAVFLGIYVNDNINAITVGDNITKAIENIKRTYPQTLNIENVFYGPGDVSKVLNMFLSNFFQGLLMVVLAMIIAMGFRNAISIAISIPLTICLTFITMYLLNIKIDQMTLVGLIIALGAIVDNSVVVGDSIQTQIDGGLDIIKSSYKGATLMGVAVFAATITTILSFFPLAKIEGVVGQFLGPISIVFIIAIIFSYIVSILFLPSIASILFKKNSETRKTLFIKKFKVKDFFLKVYRQLFKFRIVTIILTIIIFIIIMMKFVPPMSFFPYADKDFFIISVSSEKKGDMSETERIVNQIDNVLKTEKGTISLHWGVGIGIPRFFATYIPIPKSVDNAELFYRFDLQNANYVDKSEFQNYIQNVLDKEIPGAKIKVNQLALSLPGSEIEIILESEDMESLKKAKNQLKPKILSLEGIKSVDDNMGEDSYVYKININDRKAMQAGITKYDVEQQIFMLINGVKPSVYNKDAKEYNILLKSNIESVKDLELIEIKSMTTGNKIVLKEIAQIIAVTESNVYNTNNNKNSVLLSVGVLPGYSAVSLTNQIEQKLLEKIDKQKVNVRFEGDKANIIKYFGNAIMLAIVAVILIYVVLFIQFKSFLLPIIIIVTIPLGVMGSMLGLTILGKPLSLTALFGILALGGIVVNNGILLIECILIEKKAGKTIKESCFESVKQRFTPVMVTASTTILGFMPLALSNDSFFSPLATALMGGLIFSTFSTIFIVPFIYAIIYKEGKN